MIIAPFCTKKYYLHRFVQKKKIQIELNEYMSDWAPEITMGANLVGFSCSIFLIGRHLD